jgi:hypothetical protein
MEECLILHTEEVETYGAHHVYICVLIWQHLDLETKMLIQQVWVDNNARSTLGLFV